MNLTGLDEKFHGQVADFFSSGTKNAPEGALNRNVC
jgi:hypothetical protein